MLAAGIDLGEQVEGDRKCDMKLIVLKEDEFKEIEHFVETGKRIEDVRVTDSWVEQCLTRCLLEIKELKDRVEVHWEVAQKLTDVNSAAYQVWRAWKRGDDLDTLMDELGKALRK
jgi:hypothetical protein